jgi:hypothetical protein
MALTGRCTHQCTPEQHPSFIQPLHIQLFILIELLLMLLLLLLFDPRSFKEETTGAGP